MKEPLDLSYGLIKKAAHDLRAAEIGIENEAPLDTVAFHLQQCAEKLIKAFLNWKQVQYPKTHVLTALLDLASPHEPGLESFRQRLLGMVTYAVEMRYDDEIYTRGEIWAIEMKLTSSPSPADMDRLNKVADMIHASRRFLVTKTA